ncbi:MAG: hypothetical protein ABEI86_14445, partial [Halobacteriaceae archaeon]
YANEREMCGYELLKDGIDEIDLVICNYHHILDPNIRTHFFRWLGRDPNDIILVFDEAHNIEDTARDHARKAVSENTLQSALEELDDVSDPRSAPAKNVISTFLTALQRCYKDKNLSSQSIGYEWHDIEIRNENGRDDLTLEFLQNYQGVSNTPKRANNTTVFSRRKQIGKISSYRSAPRSTKWRNIWPGRNLYLYSS